jgi:hypothetical protein
MYVIAIIVLVLLVIVGYVIYKFYSIVPGPGPGPGPGEGFNADYARLGTMYGQPLFEPGLLRRCAEGSYMFTDNPTLGAFCASVPADVLDRVACRRAYHGRPIHLAYTSPAYACGCGASSCGADNGTRHCGGSNAGVLRLS